MLAGHNEDWWNGDIDKNVLLRLEVSDGTRIVAMTAASLLAATGINSHGIATGANSVFCTDNRVGVPNNFLRRWMLEASTLEEARQRACLPARARGSNHLLVDARGRIWDVETSATADVTFESSLAFVHTNHYLHDAMLPHQMALELSGSRTRYARACSLLDTGLRCGEDPFDLSFRVLADHENGELSICHHADETVPVGERESTTASMVWDVVAPSADVCAGPPCENHRTHVRPRLTTETAGDAWGRSQPCRGDPLRDPWRAQLPGVSTSSDGEAVAWSANILLAEVAQLADAALPRLGAGSMMRRICVVLSGVSFGTARGGMLCRATR